MQKAHGELSPRKPILLTFTKELRVTLALDGKILKLTLANLKRKNSGSSQNGQKPWQLDRNYRRIVNTAKITPQESS